MMSLYIIQQRRTHRITNRKIFALSGGIFSAQITRTEQLPFLHQVATYPRLSIVATVVRETWTHGIGSKIQWEPRGITLRFFHTINVKKRGWRRATIDAMATQSDGHQKRMNDSLTQINREDSFTSVSSCNQPKLVRQEGRNQTLFSVPEIKQGYFHNNRYCTFPSVVYITTILPIVCICLTFQTAVSDPPSQAPGMTRCTAFKAWTNQCPHLWTTTIFTPPYPIVILFMCIVGSASMLLF